MNCVTGEFEEDDKVSRIMSKMVLGAVINELYTIVTYVE